MLSNIPTMTSIITPPARQAHDGEQTFLTYNDATASWDLVHIDFGEELDLEEFAMGVTHWMDLVSLEPDDIEARRQLRQAYWEEEQLAAVALARE